ncbi:MAG TPA: response regulator [Fimbriimonadaceae bacterium]|jgi:CheY-like chemotaxis protein
MANQKSNYRADILLNVGFICAVLFFIASGIITYVSTQTLQRDSALVVKTHTVITAADDLLSTLQDAETGQRGYVITGTQRYLDPYNLAISQLDDKVATLDRLLDNDPSQSRMPAIKAHIAAKMQELKETISLRTDKSFAAAEAVVLSDRGKTEMDALRTQIDGIRNEETQLRDQRLTEMNAAYQRALTSGILAAIIGIGLVILIGLLVQKALADRQRQEWLQTGQVGLSAAMFGEQNIAQLSENVIKFLAEYTGAQVGAFFAGEHLTFERLASYGLPADAKLVEHFSPGEGLLGQCAKDQKTFRVDDIPDGYLLVGSSLGQSNPRHMVISPAIADGVVTAVFELGYFQVPKDLALELLSLSANPIGVTVRTSYDRTRLQNLLEETQRQGEELQVQSEELRVSNEELEEQSRALRESQARLEQQQAELEQTNVQLEEQTQVLEAQRDDLNRTSQELEEKATDLQRTSRFKSDFLANMSHELRTPLNSSLILAKLLADNRDGNLTEEQVKYATTIQAAGNDLLNLISDILDLSKIEAGHMEVNSEKVLLEQIQTNVHHFFDPIAAEKKLPFEIQIQPGVPDSIQTDSQKLQQVLKNLLSNAFKFTETGVVKLNIVSHELGFVSFEVQDTGIGISGEQSDIIFEAFRQADGTTNRKYGGTGLGLSISRELAHLLGGNITLESTPGTGSIFTLTVPTTLVAFIAQAPTAIPEKLPLTVGLPDAVPPPDLPDDRDDAMKGGRTILIVEDDETFARTLYGLAREYGFKCIIATSAEKGIALANHYVPSAVVLDIGLPDYSGLSVLDRLKHNGRTRHIPVHVVSGSDYAQAAMALGAIGYMVKPVKAEELATAFADLEQRLTRGLKRVLIVEDDPVQLESLQLLLGSDTVETVGLSTTKECLQALKTGTFDCMVLDLSLPDGSGFSLLQQLSKADDSSFPPVIVYTGRELSLDEEQQLRKYSQSIILKGAKSPERLLDEVTLFLHQVVAELPADKQKLLEGSKHRDEDLKNRRILVVEDDVRNIFALTSILEPRGAEVEIARNGREAIETLERSQKVKGRDIDLVLMDIMMPEMDGLTAMREIRKISHWKKLPIIALTAKAMPTDQQQCIEAGATDYIAKPLDVEKLLSLIRVWMPH